MRVFALLTFLVAALSSFGQPSIYVPPVIKEQNPGFTMGVQESDATLFNTDVVGATTINPNANRRDAFSQVHARGREVAQMGESTQLQVSSGLNLLPMFGVGGDSWRFHRRSPSNSVFQAGPFFVRFHELMGAVLVSDNVNFVPHSAEWGAIAELRLRLSGILQITPTWRLSVAGTIIYLPFKNEFGLEGFGLGDAIGLIAEEDVRPLTHMQLAYNSRWAEWYIQIVDDFRLRYIDVNAQATPFVSGVEGPDGIPAEDRAVRYVFGNGTTIPPQGLETRQNDFLDIRTFIELENLVEVSASRLLPTETRMTFGATHSDFWYHSGWDTGTNGLGLADHSVDRVFAWFRNERESMRFKPYAYYDAYRYNYSPNWTHEIRAGFRGPITENMHFLAEGGYTWSDALLTDVWLYRFILTHMPGPYTRQFWEYSRYVTEPVREIQDKYRYGIYQVLGPDLWGGFHIERSVFQPEQLGVSESVEDRATTRLIWIPTPRHTYIIGGSYAENRFDNLSRDRETQWEARAEIRYRIRPNLVLSILYRYINIDTKQSLHESDTAENVVILTARKYF